MKFTIKIIIFIGAFSLIFYGLHDSDFFNNKVILADLGGVPWLYASIGTLFSILAGFIVQKEWENWNNLLDSVKSEVNALRELWIWSRHLPKKYKEVFNQGIKRYLGEMVRDGLTRSERGEISSKIEKSFTELQNSMQTMSREDQSLMTATFSLFTKVLECRTNRLRYSAHHIPKTLRRTLFFSTLLVIILCLFIGIKSIWLDYIFTSSIALVSYVIFLVIEDLDNPLSPGDWHLTASDYSLLLTQIENDSEK